MTNRLRLIARLTPVTARVWLCLLLSLGPVEMSGFVWGDWGAAMADDDDDGGDDDDDDDGGSGGGDDDDDDRATPRSGGGVDRAQPTRRQPRELRRTPRPAAIEVPAFAPEIVVPDLSDADLATLLAEGFSLIERRPITTLAITLDRLAAPPGLSLGAARARVRLLSSGGNADFNHFYRTNQGAAVTGAPCEHGNCAAWTMIGWPADAGRPGACRVTVPIGLIDTGINPDHEILAGARLALVPRPGGEARSGAVHGTAVASLLVGALGSRVPGLLPEAELVAVDVFSRAAGDERADVVALIEGLDLLAARQLRLYSLSLAGPPNTVLERMLDRLTDPAGLDAVVIAAAGNGGPSAEPAWPAAHPRVIAVTAVDGRSRVYRAAQRGAHLALAAPGVDLLAATSIRGAKGKTGTSFAVPFVTAAAALLLSRPAPVTREAVAAALRGTAVDLGAPGPDPVFGSGLLSAAGFCP